MNMPLNARWHWQRTLAGCALVTLAGACGAEGNGASQGDEQATSAVSAADCAVGVYKSGTAYQAGDRVRVGTDLYECKPFPYSGWCQIGGPYAPGTGFAWTDAWTLLGSCSTGGTGGSNNGTGGSNNGTGGGNNSSCNPSAWVYMGNDPNACAGHIGESCGWTTTNLGQGYHCKNASWGVACTAGGTTCPGGSGGSNTGGSNTGGTNTGGSNTGGTNTGGSPSGSFVFSPYKDTSINMNWNTNVISTNVSGSAKALATDLSQHGGKAITLAFATGECGNENWGGVPGAAMASANVPLLTQGGIKYILSTGGAAGSFSCGSDAGMETFLSRWASGNLIGIDFDIEAGQSTAVITGLMERVKAAHQKHPNLRFSLTLATLAVSEPGSTKAKSLGANAQDSLNYYGSNTLAAVKSVLGFNGSASTWPSYLTVNLMTMDYGSPGPGICVVNAGACQMGQSALQAAYNLHDKYGIPYSHIELTPMIGGNDVIGEQFTLADADVVAQFAISQGLAGVHYWSYDRDLDCPAGPASPTCNSLGNAGSYGFLKRFLSAGLK